MRSTVELLTAATLALLASAGFAAAQDYAFEGGYPTLETVQKAYDEADLNRAVRAYRFFYPTVSSAAIWNENLRIGVVPNQRFGYLETQPRHVGFALNSDTPYGGMLLDLRTGPLVIEVPEGPLLGAVLDINQRWIMDMGLPGPDAGKGGRHLLLPPGYAGEAPDDYHTAEATSWRVIAGMRALPVEGDVRGAVERLQTIEVYPLDPATPWTAPAWYDQASRPGRVAGPAVGVGVAALRERPVRHGRLPRHLCGGEVVLSGDRDVAGDVPPRSGDRLALLARAARQGRRLSRRRRDLQAYRAAAPFPTGCSGR